MLTSVLGLGVDLVRPEVAAGWRQFSARFEGVVAHMYRDVKGLVTTGIGNLVDPMPLALHLPWRLADGRDATHDDIVEDWLRVRAMPLGRVASFYDAPHALRLSDEAIDALVSQQMHAAARALVHYYPDFADYPAAVQTCLLSMAWAMGSAFPTSFPRFSEAVRARDWAAAADECAMSTVGNAGVAPRNAANRALLLHAAQEEAHDADP